MSEGKLWVVWGQKGEYSDYWTWISGVFSSEEAAKAWVDLANAAEKKAREASKGTGWGSPETIAAIKALEEETGDPKATIYAGWDWEEVTLDALAVYLTHGTKTEIA